MGMLATRIGMVAAVRFAHMPLNRLQAIAFEFHPRAKLLSRSLPQMEMPATRALE
jgi:hypothetical protein